MKVQIRDRDALESLSLVSLLSYIRAREWNDNGPWGEGRANLYTKEHEGRAYNILVPVRDTMADYAEGMSEAVEVISLVENRSQLDVFYDLAGAGADVIRVRPTGLAPKGPLSLRQSATLLSDTYDMLASAVRAVDRPQAAYRGRISAEAAEYLESVLPLPSYHEGYTLTLHSPVPVGLGGQSDFGDDYHAPFPRRATRKLAEALGSAASAIDDVVAKDNLEPFERAVQYGVSANLCDSVAELARKARGVDIDLSWAEVRPSNVPKSTFRFSERQADILEEAAKSFRQNEPSYDERIEAQVVQLDRGPNEFDGRADILTARDGRLVRIRVEFERSVYDSVIEAFKEKLPISLAGDIFPVGRTFELRNPRNLTLIGRASL